MNENPANTTPPGNSSWRPVYGPDEAVPPTHSGPPPDSPPQRIGKKEIAEARKVFLKYKAGKANLERRLIEDELWWKLRHWEVSGRQRREYEADPLGLVHAGTESPGYRQTAAKPSSAWLFNAIMNKHADAMDNIPEPVVLPRERDDEKSAHILSDVLPVVLEQNRFERIYSAQWWEKLKHGVAAYGVFWNPQKENGLGDIELAGIDLLRIFWEPGISDIQRSRNLFITELADREAMEEQYPQYRGRLGNYKGELAEYIDGDEQAEHGDKCLIIDWYYKKSDPAGGPPRLHYVKFAGDCVLYASEDDPAYRDRGFYDHGLYPVVLDVLFPEKNTPAGFGYVALCKGPQMYIDEISANILESAKMNTRKRFFVSTSTGINESEFLDWDQPMVHVEGELDERRILEITTRPLDSVYLSVMNMKIDEMKETAANRDVNSGGTRGVSAAAAIAALQEAGNKNSRDMIAASYRSYTELCTLCLELMRQFYGETRAFRVTGPQGDYSFEEFNASEIREQPIGYGSDGSTLYRRPVFDLKVRAQRSSPFSRMEQNARAQELYQMGFFAPARAQEALGALDMMQFEGIEKIREQIGQGETLANLYQQAMELIQRQAAMLERLTQPVASGGRAEFPAPSGSSGPSGPSGLSGLSEPSGASTRTQAPAAEAAPMEIRGDGIPGATATDTPEQRALMGARNIKRTSYQEALARRSRPTLDNT